MSVPPPARPSVVSQALARDRLGVPSVIMFALTAAAPLMVVGALVSTGWGVVGTTGFPLAFLIIAVILALFSFGYVAMSRHITNAGAFYSYIAQGLGRPLGVGGAMVALIAYNLLQVGLYGAFGAFLSQFLADKAKLNVDWWIVALVLWLFVAVLGLLRVDVNSKVLMILLGAELIVVTIFDVIFFSHPAGGSLSFEPWTWSALKDGAGPAFAVATTAFVGFEAAPVFAEEARSKNRTVAVATFLGLAVMFLSYSLTSWAASASMGVDQTVEQARASLDTGGPFFPALIAAGGSWTGDVGTVLLITSIAAAALSYHNTTARYAFALGRERVLPAFFGRTRARSGAPMAGSLFQTIIAAGVLVLFAVAGWDPLVNLFFWLGTAGGVGVLVLVAATSLSVIFYFIRDARGEGAWSRLVAPILATVALGYVMWQVFDNFGLLLGFAPGTENAAVWAFPAAYAAAAVIGIVWALILRGLNRQDYEAIGLGARANTARLEPAESVEVH
ncbi:APC family permease [Dactylosporangium matsuzakiense]|uniref:Amino acid permease n=1 Tax=Dactylosporangium matsuzakiense TaxID=53360 RepID=A0A9W6KRW6_9ACTN|nr:APC family permease [Dactylosporangium matsuzakiense]UWZ44816.1 APC family permease [Dactylosporangium matsuzakiense]GLL06082.1 amino acid permease [Dactylosporangium matsuzakiense]